MIMANMSKYYKQLADNATDINDKNMYEKQARKHAINAFKKRREDLGTEAYKRRRLAEKAREEAESKPQSESEDSKDCKDSTKVTKKKAKKKVSKKSAKESNTNKENNNDYIGG